MILMFYYLQMSWRVGKRIAVRLLGANYEVWPALDIVGLLLVISHRSRLVSKDGVRTSRRVAVGLPLRIRACRVVRFSAGHLIKLRQAFSPGRTPRRTFAVITVG